MPESFDARSPWNRPDDGGSHAWPSAPTYGAQPPAAPTYGAHPTAPQPPTVAFEAQTRRIDAQPTMATWDPSSVSARQRPRTPARGLAAIPKKLRLPLGITAGALLVLLGVGIGAGAQNSPTPAPIAAPVTATPTPTPTVTPTPTPTPTPTTPPTTVAPEATQEPAPAPEPDADTAADGSSDGGAAPVPIADIPADDGADAAPSAYYSSCAEAHDAGVTPLYEGDPGYGTHLDRDKDGVACEK